MNNKSDIIKNVDNIVRIEKMGNKTFFILSEGDVLESLLDIDELEASLINGKFVRVHSKHLVNKTYFKRHFDHLTQWITLNNGDKIPVSPNCYPQRRKKTFQRFINQILHKINNFNKH